MQFYVMFAANFIILLLACIGSVLAYKSGIELGIQLGKGEKIKGNKIFHNPFNSTVNEEKTNKNDIDNAMKGFMNLMSYDGTPQKREDEQ